MVTTQGAETKVADQGAVEQRPGEWSEGSLRRKDKMANTEHATPGPPLSSDDVHACICSQPDGRRVG